MFYLIIFIAALQLTSTRAQAEEITINCDGKIYKYKKSFWSDPVVSIRTAAQWKSYCEEGGLQIYDKGAECTLKHEYEKDTYKEMVHNSKTVTKAKNIMKEDWAGHQRTASEMWTLWDGEVINKDGTIRTVLGIDEIDILSLDQYIKKYAPKIGQTYSVNTETLTIKTSRTYIIDFYLKKISRTIKDESTGDWSAKCELMPN